MTTAQRRLLEKFAAGDRPLNKAIKAALYDLDRLAAEIEQLKGARGSFRRLVRNLARAEGEGKG